MNANAHLSDLVIDRLLAGELEGTAGDEAKAHLASCGECAARHAALAKEAADFPQQMWIAGEAAKVRRTLEAEQKPKRSMRPIAQMVAFAAAASIAAVAFFVRPGPDPVADPWDGIKGNGTQLDLWVMAHASDLRPKPRRVVAGEVLAPGDVIRFEITSKYPGYATVLGLDGAGAVSVYLTMEIPDRTLRERPMATIQLDAAPIAERFFLTVCDPGVPSPEAAARGALANVGNDPRRVDSLGSGCREASILVRKKDR